MSSPTRQRVVVIGSSGLIGSAIVRRLSALDGGRRYAVVGATRHTEPPLDLDSSTSIRRYFDRIGVIHHVVVAGGDARFGPLPELSSEDFSVGLRSKLMGQVNVALEATRRPVPPRSITLTSGALAHSPIAGSSAVALVNGAIDAFARAATLDLPATVRVNVVSPGWLAETRRRLGLDPAGALAADDVADLYLQAIEGGARGQILSAEPRRVAHAA